MAASLEQWVQRISRMVDHLKGDLLVRLGDAAGANRLSVRNSDDVEVAWIDSLGQTTAGDSVFNGLGRRIKGDLSNATPSNRLMFQTTAAATASRIGIIPSAGGTQAAFQAFGLPDPDNSEFVNFGIGATYAAFNSNKNGTGVTKPIAWQIAGVTMGVLTVNGAWLFGRTAAVGADIAGNVEIAGKLLVSTMPVYANNAAAVAGGLVVGSFYRTGADPDPVCVVH